MRRSEPGPSRRGVFSSEMLRGAVERGVISSPVASPIHDHQYQPASIDLRLGPVAHRLRSSFLPGLDATVADRLAGLEMGPPLDLSADGGAVLERGRPYLVPLVETLNLPERVRARANPRSSTGRLDIFTRVVSDHGARFDEIRRGYEGSLWLEVYSNTFTVRVAAGLCLAQLRLSDSDDILRGPDIRRVHEDEGLLYVPDRTQPRKADAPMIASDGLFVGVDLPADDFAGWRAKGNSGLLDLDAADRYDVLDFWEPVFAEPGGRLVLHPEQFYLLKSRELVSIPPGYAVEMAAYDPTNGELRTHYAGFFDPGFGRGRGEVRGTSAVLEVRAHDVPFMLEHGQPVARFSFEPMAREPERLYGDDEAASHFQRQGVALPRQFRPPVFSFRMPSAG
ncbi:MAG: 2'-deoxycytidine 5'-triphosphate deaminase [Dehalococcoidia bacterium]